METSKLKKFAQFARRSLIEQVSNKLKMVLAEDSAARRESAKAVKELQQQIQAHGKEQVIEKIAYIWFNRFCALRFMDVNRYTRIGVVSPAEGQFQPEILAEAKMGYIDEGMVDESARQQIFALLDGKIPSQDPQAEAYRLLVVAICNYWHGSMPFMFERIADYTELLMPDDLLSGNSILSLTREAMTPEACEDVEVIGWLYQFYISEKKDEVFEGLKKNKKITPENIPAATQLFTPHWIVRYLVENSLGRLWMLNRPDSRLVERMEYYIRPEASVESEKWEVGSKEKHDGSEKLSGADCLAKGDGSGGIGISGNETVSKRGTLRADQSDKTGISVDTIQHSGGSSETINGRVQELSVDSARVKSGSRNANHDCSAAQLHITAAKKSNSGTVGGNQTDDLLTNSKAAITSHSPLTTSHLRISSPEEIRICDPACGSGHMLTYAFDLLYAIYEEEGYEPAEIPTLILTHNLYGIEIDERAGELAAFALTMKARAKQRRFFRKQVQPNICVLENIQFEEDELEEVFSRQLSAISKATQNAALHSLKLFDEADNFGSLIRPAMTSKQISEVERAVTEDCKLNTDIFVKATQDKVLQALRQADYLSPKYHVVIANPPYMGGKGMNGRLGKWAKDNYPNSKSDLFAMFIERNLDLAQKQGMVAMITMQSWMFLSSFEKLRSRLLAQDTILSMAHLGARAFDSIGGEVVSTTAFVIENEVNTDYKGGYLRLVDGNSEEEKNEVIREAVKNPNCGWFYRASAEDFRKIPGSPIAYAASKSLQDLFSHGRLSDVADTRLGMATADNDLFLRMWFEVSTSNVEHCAESRADAIASRKRWFPYQKGGEYRKWYGNKDYYVNWENDGELIQSFTDPKTGKVRSHNYNLDFIFRRGVTWNALTSSKTSARISTNSLFDNAGSSLFLKEGNSEEPIIGFINSNIMLAVFPLISPTLNYQPGDLSKLPAFFPPDVTIKCKAIVCQLIKIAQSDWDAYEVSWDFSSLPLLQSDYRHSSLKDTYQKLRAHWQDMTLEMQRLEEENNRIFIEAYGLQDELTPEVPLSEITLTCNPYYRYGKTVESEECEVGSKKNSPLSTSHFPLNKELEERLLADTMKEFISYAVGCMFGRYSLDKPGLILANQGETLADFVRKVKSEEFEVRSKKLSTSHSPLGEAPSHFSLPTSHLSFIPDEDNVIPMLDSDWFTDDITERFYKFLRVTFGEEHYEENLEFIEQAIGKNIRKYFLKDFYNDHVKRYKKRPIYWLFSSPKGSFNALIYMHRYRPDTVSVVLNDYLREFRAKLASRKDHLEAVSISASATAGEKTRALKEIEKINKMIAEMEDYERDVLYPLATEQVEIDLDDGVKVNYNKFGAALRKIPGLTVKK